MDNVDPTQFLAQENDEEMELDEHPPILTSLGLTHINHVRFKFISVFGALQCHEINDLNLITAAKHRQW